MKHLGEKAKDEPSKDFLTVNGTGTGHDLKSCKRMMMMTIFVPFLLSSLLLLSFLDPCLPPFLYMPVMAVN